MYIFSKEILFQTFKVLPHPNPSPTSIPLRVLSPKEKEKGILFLERGLSER
jgi:hypothetical protein